MPQMDTKTPDSALPKKPDRLTVMTWPLTSLWGQALKECVSDIFSYETGIPVGHIEFTSVDLPPGLTEALENGRRPPCEVVYCNTIPAIHLARAGRTDPLEEETFPALKEVDIRARPAAEGLVGWPFVIAYDVRYVMMYREAAFPQGPPPSWNVMLDPAFRGRVSLYPGGKGFFPVAQVMGGGTLEDIPSNMGPCWNFLKALRPQVQVMGFNKTMTEYVKRGEIDIHFTVLTNIMQWKDQGYGVFWHVPNEGASVGDDALFVPAGLEDNVSYWAKQYVATALREDVQRKWCGQLGLCPVRRDIPRPERFAGDHAYPDGPDDFSNALFVPNAVVEKYEHGPWRREFEKIFRF
jgi:putative spermidine/putrescine transport system substrate-binding protein